MAHGPIPMPQLKQRQNFERIPDTPRVDRAPTWEGSETRESWWDDLGLPGVFMLLAFAAYAISGLVRLFT
jgi:hypothetical protein